MRTLLAAGLALAAATAAAAEIALDARRSGYDFASPEIRAMQDDETANPGMLWVLQGESLWARKADAAAKSCQDCHGDAAVSMKGVAARYPAFDPVLARPLDLEQRVNRCRSEHQGAEPLAWESEDLLARCSYPFFTSHLSQHHWPLARSRADPSLALPFLATYSEA